MVSCILISCNSGIRVSVVFQQVILELKVDERRYIEDRKFYDKVRGQEIYWQRKIQFITKEGEGVTGATGPSQDLTGKVSKTFRYV